MNIIIKIEFLTYSLTWDLTWTSGQSWKKNNNNKKIKTCEHFCRCRFSLPFSLTRVSAWKLFTYVYIFSFLWVSVILQLHICWILFGRFYLLKLHKSVFYLFFLLLWLLLGVCGVATHTSWILRGDGHQASQRGHPLWTPWHRYEYYPNMFFLFYSC